MEPSENKPERKGPLSQVKKRPAAPKPKNDFLCSPRYSCVPPPAEMDLKLIDFEPDMKFYAPYRTTEIDLKHKRPMHTDPTFGVRVNLVDMNEYTEYGKDEGPPQDDLMLLDDDGDLDSGFRRKSSAPTPFLRRMDYDEYKIDKIDYSSTKKAGTYKKRTRDELMREVVNEFHWSKKKPVHPDSRKRSLQPVEIQPILPDFYNFFTKYVVVQFDEDPRKSLNAALHKNFDTTDKLAKEDEAEMVNTAITVGARDEKSNDRYLGLYVPVDDEVEKRKKLKSEKEPSSLPDAHGTADREDYHLVREYNYNVRNRETHTDVDSLYLISMNDGFASYCEVSSRLALTKRARRGGVEESVQTKRLILSRRGVNSTDREEQMEAVMQMCIGEDAAEMANVLEE